MSVLMIGPSNSGKSTLLKILSSHQDINASVKRTTAEKQFNELPPTIPTVGTNILGINVGKKCVVELRELGGSMAPIWGSYYSQSDGFIFVVDASNTQQISSGYAFLKDVTSDTQNINVPILVLFNKIDIPTMTNVNEYRELMQLEQFMNTVSSLSYLDTSCKDKSGIDDVCKWLRCLKDVKS
ncbi:ADP-ribosylation factor-like protein 16 [Ciona intestinalis]